MTPVSSPYNHQSYTCLYFCIHLFSDCILSCPSSITSYCTLTFFLYVYLLLNASPIFFFFYKALASRCQHDFRDTGTRVSVYPLFFLHEPSFPAPARSPKGGTVRCVCEGAANTPLHREAGRVARLYLASHPAFSEPGPRTSSP